MLIHGHIFGEISSHLVPIANYHRQTDADTSADWAGTRRDYTILKALDRKIIDLAPLDVCDSRVVLT